MKVGVDMPIYALLAHPGHNRVYFDEARRLALAELACALPRLSQPGAEAEAAEVAGVPYILLKAPAPLVGEDFWVLSRLSFVYAIFELVGERPLLAPIAKAYVPVLDESVSSMLKYTGKTNELFTRMMIHLGLLACSFIGEGDISLLDPVAGKGTTLFEGLRFGLSVTGVEIADKPVHEAFLFFQKYLEAGRFKHTVHADSIGLPGRKYTAKRYAFTFARNRAEQKEGQVGRLTFLSGNAAHLDDLLPKARFHLIVGDLPYGVQHANVSGQKANQQARSPKELLAACLPAWRRHLLPGGAMVLAWNTHVAPRDAIVQQVEAAGLTVLGPPYDGFAHRVDQAILRDVVVAKKV